MKKMFLMVVAAMMATMNVNAQNSELKNEIGVSYGAGMSLIGDGLGNAIGRGIVDGITGRQWTNDKQFGSLSLEYFHHTSPKFAVGGIFSYSQYGEDVVLKSNQVKEGERMRNYFTVMPAIKCNWINKEHFALYSKFGIGATFMSEKVDDLTNRTSQSDCHTYLAFQVSAIGVEFGSKLRGFVEAGVGEQGIILAGIRYKF